MVNKKRRKSEKPVNGIKQEILSDSSIDSNGTKPNSRKSISSVISNGKQPDNLSISSFDLSSDQESSVGTDELNLKMSNSTDELNLRMSSSTNVSSDSEAVLLNSSLNGNKGTKAKCVKEIQPTNDASQSIKDNSARNEQGKASTRGPNDPITNGSVVTEGSSTNDGKTPSNGGKSSPGLTTSSACLINTSATLIQSSVSVITFLAYSIPSVGAAAEVSVLAARQQQPPSLHTLLIIPSAGAAAEVSVLAARQQQPPS